MNPEAKRWQKNKTILVKIRHWYSVRLPHMWTDSWNSERLTVLTSDNGSLFHFTIWIGDWILVTLQILFCGQNSFWGYSLKRLSGYPNTPKEQMFTWVSTVQQKKHKLQGHIILGWRTSSVLHWSCDPGQVRHCPRTHRNHNCLPSFFLASF